MKWERKTSQNRSESNAKLCSEPGSEHSLALLSLMHFHYCKT